MANNRSPDWMAYFLDHAVLPNDASGSLVDTARDSDSHGKEAASQASWYTDRPTSTDEPVQYV